MLLLQACLVSGAGDWSLGTGWSPIGSTTFYIYDNRTSATRLSIDGQGRVGVGTGTPEATLDLRSQNSGGLGSNLVLANPGTAGGTSVAIDFGVGDSTVAGGNGSAQIKVSKDSNTYVPTMSFLTSDGTWMEDRLTIQGNNIEFWADMYFHGNTGTQGRLIRGDGFVYSEELAWNTTLLFFGPDHNALLSPGATLEAAAGNRNRVAVYDDHIDIEAENTSSNGYVTVDATNVNVEGDLNAATVVISSTATTCDSANYGRLSRCLSTRICVCSSPSGTWQWSPID